MTEMSAEPEDGEPINTERVKTEPITPERVAIVTGGGKGIGLASARALAETGWKVAISGRDEAALDDAVAEIDGDVLAVPGDVSDPNAVDHLFATTIERFGRLDLLFNNAGLGAPAVPVDELDVEVWMNVVAVNLTGSFLCARAAFAQMRKQTPQGGRIINNGSISATTPRPFSAPYTATKHALTGLTKSLSLDGRDIGITCGQLNLGNISSEMGDKMAGGVLQPDGTVRVEATIAVEHAANAVVYMASLPPEANVFDMTVMANAMPFVGRG